MLGIHMQRAMLVLLLVCIPLAIIWANAGNILKFLGQDPEISSAAEDYARLMIPCIFAYAILQCHARFFQTQNNVIPMIASTGTATLLHLLTCWLNGIQDQPWIQRCCCGKRHHLLDQCIVIIYLCQSFYLLQEHMDWILKGGLPWNSNFSKTIYPFGFNDQVILIYLTILTLESYLAIEKPKMLFNGN